MSLWTMDGRRFEDRMFSNEGVRCFLRHVAEVTLRLPGVLLLEIWWRNKDIRVTPEVLQNSALSSYLEMNNILQFIQTRNFDQSASIILSYAVAFLFSIFLSLPLKKLLRIYAHIISLFLLGIAHYLSVRYVRAELNEDQELRLDDLKKVEWHGSHIMAQLMLCVAQSCLLGIENDVERVMLSVFLIPIIARMCGIALGRFMLVHNLACSLAMLSLCFYALNRAPMLLNSMRQSYRALKTTVASRGLIDGVITVWHSLYFGELLSCAWIIVFVIQLYANLVEKLHVFENFGLLVLFATAESTSTPLSLLALSLTVLALVLFCSQTGFLGMPLEQKAFLLGLVLLIVMSLLLQSLYELLEPRLLELASTPHLSLKRHFRCLSLAAVLFASSVTMIILITNYLPIDLWCVMIVSDSVLTALRTLSVTLVYVLLIVETQKPEFWEWCDGLIFYTKIGTRIFELGFAIFVVIYGIYTFFEEQWSFISTLFLVFHSYFNIWQRIPNILSNLKTRRAAVRNLLRLPRASQSLLEKMKDLCAICCEEMCYEARITPCKHFFHGACLKKWLSVKQVCPLCYATVTFENEQNGNLDSEENEELDDGVNFYAFPSTGFGGDSMSEGDSESTTTDFSEYTVVTTDDEDSPS